MCYAHKDWSHSVNTKEIGTGTDCHFLVITHVRVSSLTGDSNLGVSFFCNPRLDAIACPFSFNSLSLTRRNKWIWAGQDKEKEKERNLRAARISFSIVRPHKSLFLLSFIRVAGQIEKKYKRCRTRVRTFSGLDPTVSSLFLISIWDVGSRTREWRFAHVHVQTVILSFLLLGQDVWIFLSCLAKVKEWKKQFVGVTMLWA